MLKIRNLIIFLLFLSQLTTAQVPDGYYSSANGLNGEALKTELHNIIDDHTANSYDALWDILTESDEDTTDSGRFILLYTGRSLDKSQTYPEWNREHVWAKSHGNFDNDPPAGTDAHHLRPTDVSVNSDRGSLDFDNGGNPHGEATGCYYDSDSWEPRDEVKGDVARMMFYMAVRYEGDVSGEPDLELVDYIPTSGPNFGKLSTLLEWHTQDPVDAMDRHRNEIVYSYQNNRNPFIDHPEYVGLIWGDSNQNTPPRIDNITIQPESPGATDNVTVQASVTDQTGTVNTVTLSYGTSSGDLNNQITMVDQGSYYQTESSIPPYNNGTTVYYQISATDDSSATSTSSILDYTVGETAATILSEDFGSCPPSGWTNYSLASSEDWSCSGGIMDINAYDGDAACDDWLITPGFNPRDYNNEILTFETWTEYSDTYYPPLEVKYSTDYTAGTDPSAASWNTLSVSLSPENSTTWTQSGEVDLSHVDAEQVFIAFHYTSSGSGGGSSAWWKVDNVSIEGTLNQDQFPVIDSIFHEPQNPDEFDSLDVFASISDDHGINSVVLNWGSTSGNYTETKEMNLNHSYYTTSIQAPGEPSTLYYQVEVTDDGNQTTYSTENQVTFTAAEKPSFSGVSYSPAEPKAYESVTVNAQINSNQALSQVLLIWNTSSEEDTTTMALNGTYYTDTIPPQAENETVAFYLVAKDVDGDTAHSSTYQYTIQETMLSPVIDTIRISPSHPEPGESVAVYATIVSDPELTEIQLHWGTSAETYTRQSPMNFFGGYYRDSIPGDSEHSKVYLVVEATNELDSLTRSEEFVITYGSETSIDPAGLASETMFSLFPNPTSNFVYLRWNLKEPQQAKLNLYDMNGKTWLSKTIRFTGQEPLKINLNNIPRGTYILEVHSKEDTHYQKLMKQ